MPVSKCNQYLENKYDTLYQKIVLSPILLRSVLMLNSLLLW
jgi:hypothetical protein